MQLRQRIVLGIGLMVSIAAGYRLLTVDVPDEPDQPPLWGYAEQARSHGERALARRLAAPSEPTAPALLELSGHPLNRATSLALLRFFALRPDDALGTTLQQQARAKLESPLAALDRAALILGVTARETASAEQATRWRAALDAATSTASPDERILLSAARYAVANPLEAGPAELPAEPTRDSASAMWMLELAERLGASPGAAAFRAVAESSGWGLFAHQGLPLANPLFVGGFDAQGRCAETAPHLIGLMSLSRLETDPAKQRALRDAIRNGVGYLCRCQITDGPHVGEFSATPPIPGAPPAKRLSLGETADAIRALELYLAFDRPFESAQ